MAVSEYGLSSAGFKRKRLPEIIKSIEDRIADKLGVQIETGPNSILGQLIGIYAYEIADLWELAENVYNSMYPSTAQGVALSNAAGLAGIALIDAEYTTLVATCLGSDKTAIPYGTQIAASSDSDMVFSCIEPDAYITTSKASRIDLEILGDAVPGVAYGLWLDGLEVSVVAGADDSKTDVLIHLADALDLSDGLATVTNDILTIKKNDVTSGYNVALNNLVINLVGSPVLFRCDTAGAIYPAIGAVNSIVTSYAGWISVINERAASVGREAENDISLRQRWSKSVYTRASAMVDAIAAALIEDVDGVTAVKVYENDGDTVDEYGRPQHSVEAVVAGGADADIAKVIWNRKAGGIDTFGAVSVAVYDSQGIRHNINFNRPTEVPIWLKITIADNPDEVLPVSAASEIKQAVYNKALSHGIGEDVILQRFFATIFNATSGVGYINIAAFSGETAGTYTADNIVINPREVAKFDMTRIEVVVNEP